MGLKNMFFGKEDRSEKRPPERMNIITSSELLSAVMDEGLVTEDMAMKIPAVASAVNLITDLCASIQYKLYKRNNDGRIEETGDSRTAMFNSDTGDLMTGFAMKKAFIRDYLLNGNGYIYIDRQGNRVKGLKFVHSSHVGAQMGSDVIYKDVIYYVQERTYEARDFIRIVRSSEDGVHGRGLCKENALVARIVAAMLKMLSVSLSSGGMKKGFIETDGVIRKDIFDKLKKDFRTLYEDVQTRILLLNKGLKFQPAADSAVELQLAELYDTISADVGEILGVPENIKNNTANEDEFRGWIKTCIMPVANEIVAGLNDSMLLEREKRDGLFWRADASELENGDLKHQLEAYKIGVESNIIQIDEARNNIGLPPLDFNWLRLDLASVFIDPIKKVIYTPNTNATYDITEGKLISTSGVTSLVDTDEKGEKETNGLFNESETP